MKFLLEILELCLYFIIFKIEKVDFIFLSCFNIFLNFLIIELNIVLKVKLINFNNMVLKVSFFIVLVIF